VLVKVARAAALAAIALAAVALAVVLTGRDETHRYLLRFQTAGQLVRDNDVQVAGRRVGRVRGITLTNDNQAEVEIEVHAPYAPLRAGTEAILRSASLSGVANRYVQIIPGPRRSAELDDGAVLRQDATTSIVDLDQLFATFDGETRKSLQQVIGGFAAQLEGRGREAGESAEHFNPLLSTSRRLVNQLARDEALLTRFLVSSSRAMTAVAERRDELSSLVANANTAAGAVAGESAALQEALGLLPTTLRRANTTFVNLRATLDDLDPLVAASKPATRELAPFLRALQPLLAEARPTVRDLAALVRSPGADNDAVEATRALPSLQRVASPSFENTRRALVRAQPVLEFLRPYSPDFVGWLRDFGQTTSAYDANGHYARIQPIFNAFRISTPPTPGADQRLEPLPPDQRFDGLSKGNLQRCPGAATQPATDGSSPFTDGSNLGPSDCNPSQVPPGP
jgi:phospholipid/cholesterol/gamma-HCH transport system substrate-binding protein